MKSFWLRVSSGICCHTRRSIRPDNEDSEVCTCCTPASTVTCSLEEPSSSLISREVTVPTLTTMFATFTLLKPLGDVSKVYVPTTGNAGNRYVPDGVVAEVRFSPVAVLVRVKGAFATTAPEGSVTRPVSSPDPPCAHTVPVNRARTVNTSRKRVKVLRNAYSIDCLLSS